MELLLELRARPSDAFVIRGACRLQQHLRNLFDILSRGSIGVRQRRRGVFLWLGQIRVGLGGSLLECTFEFASRPRQAVIDVVRERVQRAHRRALLRRVTRSTIVLCHVRNDHLSVALRAESPALEQRLLEVHASTVYVQPRVYVIQSVHDHIQAFPESIVENVLRVRAHAVLERGDVEVRIDHLGRVRGAHALALTDVPVAEQELTGQV